MCDQNGWPQHAIIQSWPKVLALGTPEVLPENKAFLPENYNLQIVDVLPQFWFSSPQNVIFSMLSVSVVHTDKQCKDRVNLAPYLVSGGIFLLPTPATCHR
ncbi:hypothetical protein AMECASPLE_019156 [Ameca splendens]|uniref:Uncharacterized protein n=1 Tax=Ameca splendens TaxID=208324 RepID=A0ABV1AA55_9TELE